MANRLKLLMSKLTSEQQRSFISGRQASDNIILAQEAIHSMRRKKWKKGFVEIKIDLEKAYDCICWGIFGESIGGKGLEVQLIRLIMYFVTSVSLSVIWNSEVLDNFKLGRGLRQGDPLSLYLFVLRMEVLS